MKMHKLRSELSSIIPWFDKLVNFWQFIANLAFLGNGLTVAGSHQIGCFAHTIDIKILLRIFARPLQHVFMLVIERLFEFHHKCRLILKFFISKQVTAWGATAVEYAVLLQCTYLLQIVKFSLDEFNSS